MACVSARSTSEIWLSHRRIVFEALAQVVQIARVVANHLTRLHAPAVGHIVVALRIPASKLAADISAEVAAGIAISAAKLVASAAILIPAGLALSRLLSRLLAALALTLSGLLTLALRLSWLLTGLLTALLTILALLIAGLLTAGELFDLAAQALHLGQLLIPLILSRALLGPVV